MHLRVFVVAPVVFFFVPMADICLLCEKNVLLWQFQQVNKYCYESIGNH